MIIGIGGCSRSGKTQLAQQLAEAVGKGVQSALVIHQDDFVLDPAFIPKIKKHINWEIPESIDFARFRHAIRRAHRAHDIVIVEGLLVYHDPQITALFDELIFLEIEEATFDARKKRDDRWPEPKWYREHIWASFLQYGQAPRMGDFIFLSGEEPIDLPTLIEQLSLA